MNAAIMEIIMFIHPLVAIVLIVLVTILKGLKGKHWLYAYLVGTLVLSVISRLPSLLQRLDVIDVDSISMFYRFFGIPLHIASIMVFALLIPYVIAASSSREKPID